MEVLLALQPWFHAIGIFLFFIILCGLFHYVFLKLITFLVDKLPITADADLAKAFDRPARIVILLSGLYAAIGASPLYPLLDNDIAPRLLNTVIIFCGYWIAYNLSDDTNTLFVYILHRFGYEINVSLSNILSTCIHTLLIFLCIASISSAWGFNISGFIAGLSIGGLAISMAAKDSLANIFAGLVIFMDKPFGIGDWIVCNNIEGTVESISFRSTNIRTFPQALVYIPNSLLTNTPVVNYTKRDRRRIEMTIGVTYDTTRQQIEEIVARLEKMLKDNQSLYQDDMSVAFTQMNSSSLDIALVCYSHFTDYNTFVKVKEGINLGIMKILEETGASCAFPSTSVYVEKMPKV